MERIRFDDIEGLRKRVCADFGPWGDELEVSQAMIDAFAELTGDHQWIHVDRERARRESPFGTTIAHGFLTLSLLPRLSAGARGEGGFEISGHGSVVNYGSDKLRFVSPVPAGSRIRSHSRLASVDAIEKGTRIAREVAVHVVGSEKPALLYQMITLYQPKRG